jgi:hypothetical protein
LGFSSPHPPTNHFNGFGLIISKEPSPRSSRAAHAEGYEWLVEHVVIMAFGEKPLKWLSGNPVRLIPNLKVGENERVECFNSTRLLFVPSLELVRRKG